MTKEEAQSVFERNLQAASHKNLDELREELSIRQSFLYQRLTAGYDLKPKKRSRYERELIMIRAILALIALTPLALSTWSPHEPPSAPPPSTTP